MRTARIDDMVGGWFVGDFEPSVLRTDVCEVAVKHYAAGSVEDEHWQATATELTVIISGEAEMAGRRLVAGDIICLSPGPEDASGFLAVTDVVLVAVKTPSLPADKRLVEHE